MQTRLKVSRLDVSDEATQYDALVATLGFESRSSHVAKEFPGRFGQIWAFDYEDLKVLSYEENARFYEKCNVIREPVSALRKSLVGLIEELRESLPVDEVSGERVIPRIAVDISSMDRDRLAKTVLACTEDQRDPLVVDFLYSFGKFDSHLVGSEGPVLVNRPVEGLEGWSTDPDAGIVCVLGLGYEARLATAALETIEPHQTVVMVPIGEDARYEEVVRSVNEPMLRGTDCQEFEYEVGDILQTIVNLNASVSSWCRNSRVVLVPLGPKPLALASILIGIAHPENVTVWRLSADSGRQPEERIASGTVVGVSVEVEPGLSEP